MYYAYYTDNIRDPNATYDDLIELRFKNPRLLALIIDEVIEAELRFVYENNNSAREAELKKINRLIIETSMELLGPSKAKVLDNDLNRIKSEFYWQGIENEEKVETIFWRDCYDGFVSFMRQKNKPKMTDIFNIDIDDIKGAGFSIQYISEIVSVFTQWAERLLNTEIDVGEVDYASKDEIDESEGFENTDGEDMLDGLLSMFFNFEENEQ